MATVVAQVAAAAILYRAEQRHNAVAIDGADIGRSLASRARDAVGFLRCCVAPALALVGKLSVVLTVSATASACGTLSLAAHQVLSAVFQMMRPMGDSLGQTMQTLLPQVMANNDDSFDSYVWWLAVVVVGRGWRVEGERGGG